MLWLRLSLLQRSFLAELSAAAFVIYIQLIIFTCILFRGRSYKIPFMVPFLRTVLYWQAGIYRIDSVHVKSDSLHYIFIDQFARVHESILKKLSM